MQNTIVIGLIYYTYNLMTVCTFFFSEFLLEIHSKKTCVFRDTYELFGKKLNQIKTK